MKKAKLVTTKTSRIIAWAVLRDYLFYLSDTKSIVRNNLLAGLFRGIGTAIGFSVLSAIFVYIIGLLASRNLPVIGDLIREISNMLKFG